MFTKQGTAALVAAAVLLVAALEVQAQCDPSWDRTVGNLGLNSTTWCVTATNAPSAVGPALYAGGQFSTAGGAAAKNVAKWDGNAWTPLGTGAENGGTVYAMVVSDDGILYVGGAFPNMGGLPETRRIAKWNGTEWSDVGGGIVELSNAGIRALVMFEGDLYAGGYLNEIGGVTAHKIAVWDGAMWAPLAGDPVSSSDMVRVLGVYDDGAGEAVFVGGDLENAGGDPYADYVFKWTGSAVEPLGRGANNDVEAFAVFQGDLYVGGQFDEVTQADGTVLTVNKIARWDGTSWYAVGAGLGTSITDHVWALAVFDDGGGSALYAGGSFSTSFSRIAKWDGASWSAVGVGGLNGYIYSMARFDHVGGSGLFAVGTFSTHDGQTAQRIAEWRGGLPATPSNAAADPPQIETGESSELTASVPGATIDWYTGGCADTWVATGDSVSVSPAETTTYYVQASIGPCASPACAEVTVTVCDPPVITVQPLGGVICDGHTHEVCVTAEGDPTLRYQWKRGAATLLGATSSCYVASQPGSYWCVVSNDCGTAESDTAEVVEASPATGDLNGDGAADLVDYGLLADCLGGPGMTIEDECICADVNEDGAIDLADFAQFQVVYGD